MQCKIARKFFEMLTTIVAEQKFPMEYPGGQVLYHAEMDLLEKISKYPESNVSMLSKKSGVTKSAITQISTKLLEKELIERYQNPKNKKEKYFRLAKTGESVLKRQEEYHKAAADEIRGYLCSLEKEDKKIILEFMEKMQKYMPAYVFPCQCGIIGNSCLATEEEETEDLC